MMRKKQLTEEEKRYQAQRNLEKELQNLFHEYYVLDKASDHSQYSRSSSLEKCTKVLDIFKREHLEILTDLLRATATGRIKKDEKLFEKLTKMIVEKTWYEGKVNTFKIYLKELDEEKKMVKKRVHLLQKQQITDRQYEDRIWKAIKTVEALENKLETQMIQFGTICTKNFHLRTEINHHLLLRETFMEQWSSLIDKLTEGKKIMLDLIEQATIAYNQREEWCNKLQVLRLKAHAGLNANIQEMNEQIRRYDQNLKLREFFSVKSQKRVMQDLMQKRKLQREMTELKLKERLEYYINMLGDIKKFTKIDNVKKMAQSFTTQEGINLSNFKYIISAIRETEEANDLLGILHLDIDEKAALNDSRLNQQMLTIAELEAELEEIQTASGESEQLLLETDANFNELLQGVSSLFKLCRCDKDPLLRLLGNNNEVYFYNVLLYLELLEKKVHEFLLIGGFKDSTKKGSDPKRIIKTEPEIESIYGIEAVVLATPCSLCAEHEMVSDVNDTLQKVWSKEEIKSKLKRRKKSLGGKARLHTISKCQLPKARQMIQRRYE